MANIYATNNTANANTITIDTSNIYSAGTITLNGSGTSGTYLTSGSSSYTWATPNTSFGGSNNNPVMTIPHGQDKVVIEEKAELEVKGKVKINGVDLEERLKTIETVLNIPTRDAKMEAKYPKLKKLYEEYTKELEKYKTWDRLNDE